MPAVDLLIAVIAGAVALRARVRVALAAVVATVLLIPNILVVPGSPISLVTIQRVALLGLLVNLVLRVQRGQLPGSIFALTPIHAVFVGYLVVAFVLGVVLAQPDVSVTFASQQWANYLDEFAFFVAGLAAIRAIDDMRAVLRILSVLLVITALIAIGEHFTSRSWASLFFKGTGQESSAPLELAPRGEGVRARVASQFSLAYAWWAVAVVPVYLVYMNLRPRRRWLVVPGLLIIVLALFWTQTRSIAAPLLFTLLVVPLLSRNRQFAILGVFIVALMGIVFATSSEVSQQFSRDIDQGSIDVRFARIPPITAYVADHAFGGLGFTGVENLGFRAVDSSYLLLYGDIGVIGLTMLALLYATAFIVVARGVFSRDTEYRLIAAAATIGVGSMIVAGFVFDSVTQLEDQRVLWLLAGIGVVAAERSVGAPRWFSPPTPSRVVAVAMGVAGGFLLYLAAPTHVAVTFQFSTLSPFTIVKDNPPNTGKILIHSVCNTVAVGEFDQNGAQLTCRDLATGPGFGELRLQAPDRRTARETLQGFVRTVNQTPRLQDFQIVSTAGPRDGRPTVFRTAPVWLPMIIGVAAILLPRERRRRPSAAPPAPRRETVSV